MSIKVSTLPLVLLRKHLTTPLGRLLLWEETQIGCLLISILHRDKNLDSSVKKLLCEPGESGGNNGKRKMNKAGLNLDFTDVSQASHLAC